MKTFHFKTKQGYTYRYNRHLFKRRRTIRKRNETKYRPVYEEEESLGEQSLSPSVIPRTLTTLEKKGPMYY